MAGPTKPFLAGAGARGGQYVTVPAFAAPGQSFPSNSRDAPGSTVVYSPKGWKSLDIDARTGEITISGSI